MAEYVIEPDTQQMLCQSTQIEEGEYNVKKVMVLGASFLQSFVINKVKQMGHFCIALDGNPASESFALADKSYACSTTDMDEVLRIAREEQIDGIMTYASDVAAPTAAYVAEKMNLPTNPYVSVDIMTDKAKTRLFMEQNGFHVPKSRETKTLAEAVTTAREIGFPVIVKPTDASGSKGVTRVDAPEALEEAFAYAMSFSRSKTVIVETFLVRDGYQIDADCFMYNGELVYFNPMDQHQDRIAPYSPIGISAPSILDVQRRQLAHDEVSRFLKLLNMRFGEYNVEYIFDAQGRIYILEIGPRTGGNLIPDVIREGTGFDIVAANVKAHLGEPCEIPSDLPFVSNVTSFIIHSQEDGIFDGLDIHPEVEKGIQFLKLFVQPGEQVKRFTSGIYAMGFCLMKFEDHAFMLEVLDNSAEYIKVKVR